MLIACPNHVSSLDTSNIKAVLERELGLGNAVQSAAQIHFGSQEIYSVQLAWSGIDWNIMGENCKGLTSVWWTGSKHWENCKVGNTLACLSSPVESLLLSHSAMSNCLRPHGLQQLGFPVPHHLRSLLKLMFIESVMPSNISYSVVPFSSCLQSFPASGSF